MYKRKRQRLITHGIEDQREEIFEGLKMKLDVMHELNDVFANDADPLMRQQVEIAKQDLRDDFRQLIASGVSIMDLYKKFGALVFKSDILEKQQILQQLSGGKEKQLLDLLNEDDKLVQRLNVLNDPINQKYRQLVTNVPLRIDPDNLSLKQQYEKDQIMKKFAQQFNNYVRGRGGGAPRGGGGGAPRGGGRGAPRGGGRGAPKGSPPRGGGGHQPPPGRPQPPPYYPPGLPPYQPQQPPQQPPGNPPPGPQGGGGAVMRQPLGQVMQQMQQFTQQQQPFASPPRVNADLALQVARQANILQQQQNKPLIIKSGQKGSDVKMQEEEKQVPPQSNWRNSRLLVFPVPQKIQQQKQTSLPARIPQPIQAQPVIMQRASAKSRSKSRQNIPKVQQQSPSFQEIKDPKSGFFLLADKPLDLTNKKQDQAMENETEQFFSPQNSPQLKNQLKKIAEDVKQDEIQLRRPSQTRSKSQHQQDVQFMAQINETNRQRGLQQQINKIVTELFQIQGYNEKSEQLLKEIQEPLSKISDVQLRNQILDKLLLTLPDNKIVKGVPIDDQIKRQLITQMQPEFIDAFNSMNDGIIDQQTGVILYIQNILQFFDELKAQQMKYDKAQQTQPVMQQQQMVQQPVKVYENDEGFKKWSAQLYQQGRYAEILTEAVGAVNNDEISFDRFYKTVGHISSKFPSSTHLDIVKIFQKYQRSDDTLRREVIDYYLPILFNYFIPEQQQPIDQQQLDQQQQVQQQQIEEIKQENINQSMQEEQPQRGRAQQVQQVQVVQKDRSTSQIRATNKDNFTFIRQSIQQQNYKQAIEHAKLGIENHIQNELFRRKKAGVEKPDFYFDSGTREVEKIINEIIDTNQDPQIQQQLRQEYQALGVKNKTSAYAKSLDAFLQSILDRFFQQ